MAVINKFALEGKDDFLGFTFNNRHSSEFRIIRVITNNRYDTELLSAPKDTTTDIPGNDGLYFVKTKYQQKTIPLNFAFDDLYDEDIRSLKEWLSEKTPCELIFDEDPYRAYYAKVTGVPKISWISFDTDDGRRVYKGEGNVSFICYYPYAHSLRNSNTLLPMKTIEDYKNEKNINEWKKSSGLKTKEDYSGYDIIKEEASDIKVYNGGNIATPWQFIFKINSHSGIQSIIYSLGTEYNVNTIQGQIYIDTKKLENVSDTYFLLDAKLHLLLGVKNTGKVGVYEQSGNIYNYAIVAGDFFNIQPGEGVFHFDPVVGIEIKIIPENIEDRQNLIYDYLYY